MKQMTRERADMIYSVILTVPTVIITGIFIFIPIIDSVIKSFLQYGVKNVISGTPGVWNNFQNYIRLFRTDIVLRSSLVTLRFVIGVILLQFLLGMFLALVLNSNIKGARFFRSIMMTPWVVPTVISALIWMWIFQPQYGVFKFIASLFGKTDVAMLNNPVTALAGIGIAALWKQIPLMTLLLLAGMQNIPNDVMEAAIIDGAGTIRRFFSVTVPFLSPVIKVAISMSIIENFKQFPLFWTMTGGGPNGATTNLAILSYREAFVSMNMGSGAAVTTIWMILMIVVVGLYNKLYKTQDMS